MQTPDSTVASPPAKAPPFGVNAMRLNARQWLAVGLLSALICGAIPRLWPLLERFDHGTDYRVPYSLSQDYWLWQRWLREAPQNSAAIVLGDSVIWGEYVRPEGTLTHFLNTASGTSNAFVNAGMNGLFPLALEGLADYYGGSLRHKKVLLHCNLLWLSSPKADLQTDKEEKFNHARLVPQFSPRIPCYRASANDRLGILVERNLGIAEWVSHLQDAYFEGKSILRWTLQDNGADPALYPNSYRNPLAQIKFQVPVAPSEDPQRGPASARHVPWTSGGAKPARFEWVELGTSLQWQAFQRLALALRQRGNEVFVLVGPFNEHFLAADNQPAYQKLRTGVASWLEQNHFSYYAPAPLPSELYADASHPLTAGYAQLAQELAQNGAFQKWLRPAPGPLAWAARGQ